VTKPIKILADAEATPLKSVMKWVGIVAAVLSLIAGIRQFVSLTAESEERERRLTELLTMGEAQQSAADYPQAWTSFEAALVQAEQGNFLAKLTRQLGEQRQHVRTAQENLAMQWLENISVPQGKTFASVVDPLLPVLHRGVIGATNARVGDLYAHIGWGYFLKRRDGQGALDPAPWYAKALQADAGNPYAHAYSGHWQAWNNQSLDGAMQAFDAALASNRERAYVRNMQISALMNRRTDETQITLVKVANDMRKNDEPMDERTRRELRSVYVSASRDEPFAQRLIASLPNADQLATIKLVQPDAPADISLTVITALLQEADEQRASAIESWRAVRAALPAKSDTPLAKRADAAIKRLSR
jgi:hypothetical protein